MKVVFSSRGWDDYLWWHQQDRKVVKRVNRLIQDVTRNGNDGIGKPEPLKHGFQGYWSRRINDEHRLVYGLVDDEVRIAACRYHYERCWLDQLISNSLLGMALGVTATTLLVVTGVGAAHASAAVRPEPSVRSSGRRC